MFGVAQPQMQMNHPVSANANGPVCERMPRNERVCDAMQGLSLTIESLEAFAMEIIGETSPPRPAVPKAAPLPLPVLLDNLPEVLSEASKRIHQVRDILYARLC